MEQSTGAGMDLTDPTGDEVSVATAALTALARRQDSEGYAADFAGALASVLASTAANLGGVECLLEGRSGSWEASLVRSLVNGTVPDEPDALARYRTEPIHVPLNVAELVEDRHGLTGLDEAITALDDRYSSLEDYEADTYEREAERVRSGYISAYADYANRFAGAVAEHESHFEGLQVPVVVEANADPCSPWWRDDVVHNPSPGASEPLVWLLWERAREAIGLPGIPPSEVGAAAQ